MTHLRRKKVAAIVVQLCAFAMGSSALSDESRPVHPYFQGAAGHEDPTDPAFWSAEGGGQLFTLGDDNPVEPAQAVETPLQPQPMHEFAGREPSAAGAQRPRPVRHQPFDPRSPEPPIAPRQSLHAPQLQAIVSKPIRQVSANSSVVVEPIPSPEPLPYAPYMSGQPEHVAQHYRYEALLARLGSDYEIHPPDGIGKGKSSCGDCGKAGCVTCQRYGFFATGSYLNWRTNRPTQPFTGITNDGFDPDEDTVVDMVNAEFGRDSGFRAGLGYRAATGIDIGFMYTDFSNSGSSSIDNSQFRLLPLQAHPAFITASDLDEGLNLASSTLQLDYNTYDLEVGKMFLLCNNVVELRPFAGVRFAEIDQRTDIHYEVVNGGATDTDDINILSSMSGWGLRAGGDFRWNVHGSGLSVFSRSALSVLLAEFKNTRVERLSQEINQVATGSITTNNEFDHVVPVVELAAGVSYCRGHFRLNAGYEFGAWFNMVNDIRYMKDSITRREQLIEVDRDKLTFDGWFLQLEYFH